MNIFESIKKYNTKWSVESERSFNAEEIKAVKSAVVVESNYGNSVRFDLVGGSSSYIPLATDSPLTVGESVDLTKAKLVRLVKEGENPINRVK